MGVDAFLFANSPKDVKDQEPLAYIRESYGHSPYPTRALLREAYESENCVANISAELMRERLTNVTEPFNKPNNAHNFVMRLQGIFQEAGIMTDADAPFSADTTAPATVDELIVERHRNAGGADEHIEETREQYYNFVRRAEDYERETGKHPFVYVWY
jgi:hypothetical protein